MVVNVIFIDLFNVYNFNVLSCFAAFLFVNFSRMRLKLRLGLHLYGRGVGTVFMLRILNSK